MEIAQQSFNFDLELVKLPQSLILECIITPRGLY